MVSLVPSHTETLVEYGLIERLVGRTRYCVEPSGSLNNPGASQVAGFAPITRRKTAGHSGAMARFCNAVIGAKIAAWRRERVFQRAATASIAQVAIVGGTKDPDIQAIVALEPDLVVINREENRVEDYHSLVAAGLEVYVTHPRSVDQAIAMLVELGQVCGAAEAGARLGGACRRALAAVSSKRPALATFCPVWRNPWMTFSANTYVSDMLAVSGFANVFADADAGRGDFFEVSLDEVAARKPEIVILPDEPYVFSRKHVTELQALEARFFLIDGKDLSWYGPRIPGALERLSSLVRTK